MERFGVTFLVPAARRAHLGAHDLLVLVVDSPVRRDTVGTTVRAPVRHVHLGVPYRLLEQRQDVAVTSTAMSPSRRPAFFACVSQLT